MPHRGLLDHIKHIIQVELEASLTPNAITKVKNINVQII